MVAILIGIMFYGQELTEDGVMNINGALFLFLTNMTFQNVFAVINVRQNRPNSLQVCLKMVVSQVFCSELPIFMRENANGMYRADVYFLCKTLAEIPIFIAIPVLFTTVTYFMIGLANEPYKFFNTALIVTLVANVATSFGKYILLACILTTQKGCLFLFL
jgi:ATP-binding cassette, subfamily G (WHITE), eye pigment precursor transporter